MSLSLAAMPVPSLQPFHESVAAAKQRFVLRTQRSFALAPGIQPTDLPHGPTEPAAQTGNHSFKVIDEILHMGAENGRRNHFGVRVRPILFEYVVVRARSDQPGCAQ